MVGITVDIGVAESCTNPFVRLIVPIGGQRKIRVFDSGIFAERPLGEQNPPKG